MCEKPFDAEALVQDTITRIYNCPKCKTTHTVKLAKNLSEERNRFPFPYAFLHSSEGQLQDLLTIAYLDAELQIRGVDVIEINDSEGIFSQQLTKEITEKLMDTIVNLQNENARLQELVTIIDLNEIDDIIEEEDIEFDDSEKEVFACLDDLVDVEEETIILNDSEGCKEEIPYEKRVFTLRSKTPAGIKYKTPASEGKKISVFISSTIGPGEKKQKLTIDTNNKVSQLKETVANIYGLDPFSFHLSSGGITMDETSRLLEYTLEEGDEILIIPSSVAGIYLK